MCSTLLFDAIDTCLLEDLNKKVSEHYSYPAMDNGALFPAEVHSVNTFSLWAQLNENYVIECLSDLEFITERCPEFAAYLEDESLDSLISYQLSSGINAPEWFVTENLLTLQPFKVSIYLEYFTTESYEYGTETDVNIDVSIDAVVLPHLTPWLTRESFENHATAKANYLDLKYRKALAFRQKTSFTHIENLYLSSVGPYYYGDKPCMMTCGLELHSSVQYKYKLGKNSLQEFPGTSVLAKVELKGPTGSNLQKQLPALLAEKLNTEFPELIVNFALTNSSLSNLKRYEDHVKKTFISQAKPYQLLELG
jgi:hypothetical protein